MTTLEKFFNLELACATARIGVIGDAMLDQYFNVKVKKISPEFPIPVMHSDNDSSQDFPGGAANVAYQFKHFNVEASLISFVDSLAALAFASHNVDTKLSLQIDTKIPRKKRFYSDDFPTYRWDVEQLNYGIDDLEKKCLELFTNLKFHQTKSFDAVIFSDYDKGVLFKHMNSLISEVPISVVDPKRGDINRWIGCTVFKPNASEALALTGCSDIFEAGKKLLAQVKCKAVVITESGNGVVVFDEEGIHEIRPTTPLPLAESVIGAGDCFTAFLTMALVRGMSIRESAEVAWKAGTMYVLNRHNKPISRSDLAAVFDSVKKKLQPPSFPASENRNYKLVFTNGCFDILHSGHISTLQFAKSLGDKLVVAVNSDESVAKLKPGRPYVTLNDRIKLLSALECVDFIVTFDDATPIELIRKIKPDVLVKGADYKKSDIVGADIVKEVYTAPIIEGLSTTELVQKIKSS